MGVLSGSKIFERRIVGSKLCPICEKVEVQVGKVVLLFENGRLWLVDKIIGHLADAHNLAIPRDLVHDVVSQKLLTDLRTTIRIDHRPGVVSPEIFGFDNKRTVPTGFSFKIDELFRLAEGAGFNRYLR